MKTFSANVPTDLFPKAMTASRHWGTARGYIAEYEPVDSTWKASLSTRNGSPFITVMGENREDMYEASTTPLVFAGEDADHISGATSLIETWIRKKERCDFYHRSLKHVAKGLLGVEPREEGHFDYSQLTSLGSVADSRTVNILTASEGLKKFPIWWEDISRRGSGMLMETLFASFGEFKNWSDPLGTMRTFQAPSTMETLEHVRILSEFETTFWSQQIAGTTTREGVIMVLRRAGLERAGDSIRYIDESEAEEPDPRIMSFGSLKELARFLISERKLGQPSIGVSPDGLAHAQWRVREKGILAMQFHATGDIRFAAVSGPFQSGIRRDVVYGTMSKEKTLEAIRAFTSKLEDGDLEA